VDSLGEEWDPVGRDNIMYSAYVQSMALLHDYLFASDRYAAPGSLTFQHWSFFWGGPEKRFAYDRESLNEHLYRQLVDNGYLGVACEPNCVFQICNQPAILGFRLHDLITGGKRAEEVVAGYERAWADIGRLDEAGPLQHDDPVRLAVGTAERSASAVGGRVVRRTDEHVEPGLRAHPLPAPGRGVPGPGPGRHALPGTGTVTIGRVLGRGRWRAVLDGVEVTDIDGDRASGSGFGVRGGDLVFRCAAEPAVLELAPRR
jgi:hypothetical protein